MDDQEPPTPPPGTWQYTGPRLTRTAMPSRTTRDRIAAQLGQSAESLRSYQKGTRAPTAANLGHLAAALGVTPLDFYTWVPVEAEIEQAS